MCGFLTTGAVLAYGYTGACEDFNPEQNYYSQYPTDAIAEGIDLNSYYTLNTDELRVRNQVEVLHSFVSTLIENSQALEPEYSGTVTKYFWELG